MAITVSFTTNQVAGEPSEIVINDNSTGSDVSASTRRVTIVNSQGEYVTEDGVTAAVAYTTWPIADGNTLTLDLLTSDGAFNITLTYVTSGGATVATDTLLQGFTLYNETFYYSLTQAQASQNQPPPMIIQDTNYYSNKMILRTEIDSGDNAIVYGDDITTAQSCYDRATYMRLNESKYF